MYLIEQFSKEMMKSSTFDFQKRMYRLDDAVIEQADECEVWGTSFDEGDEDYCEFRFKKDGEVFSTKRIAGY